MSAGPKFMAAVIGEVASALPGGSILGALVEKMMEAREEAASEILVEEIRLGKRPIEGVDPDEMVAKVYRYSRAAQEGAARRNLRMLARVLTHGTFEQPTPAGQFLSDANILAGLRHEECVLLGLWAKVRAEYPQEEWDINSGVIYSTLQTRLLKVSPIMFPDRLTFDATLGALTRTGLVVSVGALDGGSYRLGPMFNRLMAMKVWEIPAEEIIENT